jgi:hypothetical protein
MESTLQLVSVVLWLAVALTCLLLTIHTLNRTRNKEERMFFFLLGSGFSLGLYNGLCPVVQLLLS